MNDRKPRILILTQNPQGGAGAERVVANLTDALQDQFEFLLAYPRVEVQTDHDLQYHGRHIELDLDWKGKGGSLRHKLGRYKRLVQAIRHTIQSEKADLVMSNLSMDWHQVLILIKALNLTKAKVVLRFGNPLTPALKGRSKLATSIIRMIAGKVDHVIANSEGTRQDVIQQLGIPATKITALYNPLKLEDIRRKAKAPFTHEAFNKKGPVLVNVGRLDTQKNQGLLIKAFHRVLHQQEAQLVLVGSGAKEATFKQLAEDLGISDKVHFAGWQDNPYQFVAQSDLFVLSSDWEGFGNVLIEAMACKCPIVSTDALGAPAELLQRGKYGLVVPNHDEDQLAEAILQVLQNEELRQRLIQNGLKRANDFDLPVSGGRYGQLFNTILSY